MDETAAQTWIRACAHGLQQHWSSVDPRQLEEVARELWERPELRPMTPADAVALWLTPIRSSREALADPAGQQR